MRKQKRFLSLFLALVMVFCSFGTTLSAEAAVLDESKAEIVDMLDIAYETKKNDDSTLRLISTVSAKYVDEIDEIRFYLGNGNMVSTTDAYTSLTDKDGNTVKASDYKADYISTKVVRDVTLPMYVTVKAVIDGEEIEGPRKKLGTGVANEDEDAIHADVQNANSTLDIMTYDTDMWSTNSTESLKLGINGGSGKDWAKAEIFVSSLIGWKPVDLVGKTVTFDVKTENSAGHIEIAAERSGMGLAGAIYVGLSDGNADEAKGWKCTAKSNGWYKVSIDMDKAFGGYQDRVFKFQVTILPADKSSDTTVYIDNLYLGTDISELVEGVGIETDDAIKAVKYAGNSNMDAVVIESSETTQTPETSLYSTQSMRMTINAGKDNVWAAGNLVVSSLVDGENLILSGKTISFDMKLDNAVNFVRVRANTPGVGWSSEDLWISCGGSGNGWSSVLLGNGWYRFTMDMDVCIGDYAKAVSEFEFLISNENQEKSKASNVYIDNMMLGELVTYISNEEEDAIQADVQNVNTTLDTMTYDTSVLSTNSTKSLKLGINGGSGKDWAKAEIFISSLLDGWKPVDLVGKTVTFDVKTENSVGYLEIAAERSGVGLAGAIYVGLSDGNNDEAKGWRCTAKSNGWYKVSIDMDKAFGGYQDRVFKFQVTIAPADKNLDTTVYIDNLYLGTPIKELKEGIRSEANDAINAYSMNVNDVASIFGYNTEEFALYSEHSLESTLNADNTNQWVSFEIQVAELNDWSNIDLSEEIVEFDIKPINTHTNFGIAPEAINDDMRWVGHNSADDAAGWSCWATGAGWYHVTLDMDKAFPNHATSMFKFFITYGRADATQAASLFIDNLKIGFADDDIEGADMWRAENTESVMRSATKPNDPTTDLSMEAMKGETESVQLMIRPWKNDISAYRVTASDLTDGNGNVIAASNVEILSQHYIQTTSASQDAPTTASMATGWYPDALIPIDTRIKAGENTIAAGATQGFWINVDIPADVPAGTYTGVVKVLLDTKYCELPLTVTVHNLTMPETMHNKMAFGLWYNYIDEFGGYGSVDNALYENYYNFLVDKRVIPYDIPTKGYSTPEEYADYLVQYAQNPKVPTYNLPYKSVKKGFSLGQWLDLTYYVIDQDYMTEILTAMAEKNKALWDSGDHETDLFEKAILYAWEITDEPTDKKVNQIKQCDQIVTAAKTEVKSLLEGYPKLQESLMKISHVVTRQEYSSDFAGNDTDGGIQTWCLYVNQYEENGFTDIMEARRNADGRAYGEDFWWYHCQEPGNPYPSFFIDDNLISTRTITWMQKHYDVTGYLEWCVNFWQKYNGSSYVTRDIWSDPASFNGKNGDGQLIYSGSKYGLNEPISTLRLESTREANEDYEYLWMFEQRIAELNQQYSKTYDSDAILNTFYSRIFTGVQPKTDVDEFKSVRSELLQLLDDMYNDPTQAIAALDQM